MASITPNAAGTPLLSEDSTPASTPASTPGPSTPGTPVAPIFAGGRLRHTTLQEQIDAVPPNSTLATDITNLPRLIISGGSNRGHYILEKWLHNSRPRRSWINDYGHHLVRLDSRVSTDVKGVFWACSLCDKRRRFNLYAIKATSSAQRHLKDQHHISESGQSTEESTGQSTTPQTIISQLQRAPITNTAALLFKANLLRLIVDGDLAFTVVGKPGFSSSPVWAERIAHRYTSAGIKQNDQEMD